jgi:carbon-monoxide dehydrogenase small subunit
MTTRISFRLNGSMVGVDVEDSDLLLDVLRNRLGSPGTKEGCGQGECGACSVLIDGRAVNSCIYPALEAEGASVVTIEGLLEPGNGLSALQAAFVERGGIQCGFCSPGMIVSAKALLDRNPDPTEDEICEALAGNLCRCTGYIQIIESVKRAAALLRGDGRRGGSR